MLTLADKCGKSESHIYALLSLLQLISEGGRSFSNKSAHLRSAGAAGFFPRNSLEVARVVCKNLEVGKAQLES
jgi:hypothetical protein